ncbi:MAG: hypothetical protein AB7N71_13825, partial [Phycisphaerae bacterium]
MVATKCTVPYTPALLFLFCLNCCTALTAGDYLIRDLGTLPGGDFSRATDINDAGNIVGESPQQGEGGYTHAVAWINDQIVNITGSGYRYSGGLGINNQNEVVGVSDDGTVPFHWNNGVLIKLPPLQITGGIANAINDQSRIVGAGRMNNGNAVATMWYQGSVTSLGTLGGSFSEAYDINEAGEIVGYAAINATKRHAFRHDGIQMHDLGTLGGQESEAFAINEGGTIVGRSHYDATWQHAFVYDNGSMTDLGTLGGLRSAAYGINDDGIIVGESSVSGTSPVHAVIWEDGVIADLNARIEPASGWVLHGANAINTRGQIAGVGTHNGQTRGFLMTPLIVGDMNCDARISVTD